MNSKCDYQEFCHWFLFTYGIRHLWLSPDRPNGVSRLSAIQPNSLGRQTEMTAMVLHVNTIVLNETVVAVISVWQPRLSGCIADNLVTPLRRLGDSTKCCQSDDNIRFNVDCKLILDVYNQSGIMTVDLRVVHFLFHIVLTLSLVLKSYMAIVPRYVPCASDG